MEITWTNFVSSMCHNFLLDVFRFLLEMFPFLAGNRYSSCAMINDAN